MAYCTVLDAIRISGIFNQTLNEAVGTGDGSETSFTFDNDNIVKTSEKVYVAGTLQTRDTDYSINNETGVITFLSTPPGNSEAVTAHYKYYPDSVDFTNDDVEDLISDADAEIDNWTGKSFENGTTQTDYFEGRGEKVMASDQVETGQFYTESFEDKYVLLLTKYPVQSITSLQFLEDDGTVDETLTENTDFHSWENGKIQLITSSIPAGKGKKKVKVTYTYGYSSVPRLVKRLSATLTAIMMFVNLTGGSFDEITSYTLGPKSVAVGEPYMNMREAIKRLEEQKAMLLKQVGREVRTAVI